MLCRTATQIIRDDFVRVHAFVPSLWNIPLPRKPLLDAPMKEGRIHAIDDKWGRRYSVRNVIDFILAETGRTLFSTADNAVTTLLV